MIEVSKGVLKRINDVNEEKKNKKKEGNKNSKDKSPKVDVKKAAEGELYDLLKEYEFLIKLE